MSEIAMMEKLFLLAVERLLMEIRTEKTLVKLFSSTHEELTALTDLWERLEAVKMARSIEGFSSEDTQETAKKITEKMNSLLSEF